ncbi:MAG: pyridoxamine 5'-phosphate oxidase family protein [Myxococcota bacterium]
MGDASPFHPGERAVQARAGVREAAERLGRAMFRDAMPDPHRELFEKLRWLVLGGADADGQVWASVVTGAPGFVATPDPRTLVIDGALSGDDPLRGGIAVGSALGVLGIELETRRRNRANGLVTRIDLGGPGRGFAIGVRQSFGNCPRYIHTRAVTASTEPPGAVTVEGARLSDGAADQLRRADTLFVATVSADPTGADPFEGADVSHRGGRPGFVRVAYDGDGTTVSLPDFPGNNAFDTLGNLAVDPRAGVAVLDPATGDLLQLTGVADVEWRSDAVPGVDRVLRFRPTGGRWRRSAVPLRWTGGEASPHSGKMGDWPRDTTGG